MTSRPALRIPSTRLTARKAAFEGLSAEDIAISKEWLEDANYITASETGGNSETNDNILKMIAALDSEIDISPYFTGRFREFVLSLMSDVSIDLNYKKDMLSIAACAHFGGQPARVGHGRFAKRGDGQPADLSEGV